MAEQKGPDMYAGIHKALLPVLAPMAVRKARRSWRVRFWRAVFTCCIPLRHTRLHSVWTWAWNRDFDALLAEMDRIEKPKGTE